MGGATLGDALAELALADMEGLDVAVVEAEEDALLATMSAARAAALTVDRVAEGTTLEADEDAEGTLEYDEGAEETLEYDESVEEMALEDDGAATSTASAPTLESAEDDAGAREEAVTEEEDVGWERGSVVVDDAGSTSAAAKEGLGKTSEDVDDKNWSAETDIDCEEAALVEDAGATSATANEGDAVAVTVVVMVSVSFAALAETEVESESGDTSCSWASLVAAS
jgi:hypothetical protein